MIRLARTRTRQPQFAAGIDWRNPITRGLVAAINPAIGRDMVTGAPLVFSGASLVTRKSGRSALSNGSSTFAYVDLPSRTYTQGTILAVTEPVALAMNTGVVQFASMASLNPIVSIRTGNTTSSSKIRLWLRGDDGGTVGEDQGDGALDAFAVGKTSVATITFKVGGRYYAFANGIKDTKSESVSSSALTLSRLALGALSFAGGTADFYSGASSLVLVFDRVKNDGEIASLSANPWQVFKGRKAFIGVGVTVQIARPISDISNTGWVPSSGTDLHPMIGETVRNDATYIAATVVGALSECGLESIGDPNVSTGHLPTLVLSAPGGGGITVRLRQGTTTIASWTYHPGATPTEYTPTLSGAEADSITDYTALRLQFEAIA